MKNSTRNLLALVLVSALASPMAFADPSAAAGSNNAGGTPAAAPAAAPTMPPQANSHAADAMGNPTPNTPAPAANANANTSHDNMKDEAQYPPGKGDWWKAADANGDGLLTSTEAANNPFLTANFASIDTNGDGLVSQEEYRSFYTNTASQGHSHQ
jgi:hypothetical protein